MKKTIKIVSIITLMILMLIQGSAYASFNITEASLYNKGDCGDLLKYKGALLYSSFVVYQKDGVEYPAYCLNANLPGVMESGPYTVTTNNLLTNQAIWRVIVNGYPYKTPQELGVANREEAFTATKQAVYCILYGNDANNFSGYTAVGAAGQRTLNALKQIVTAARNSNETKQSSNINITPNANKLEIDNINKNYLSITYNVSSYEIQGSYNVELTGKIPQNTLVTDVNNNSKNEFKQGEKFKILIPIQNLDSVGNFGISVKAAVKTKPVFYGKAPSTSLQDYAITATMVEEGVGTTTLNYTKNVTNIKIVKQDGTTLEKLEGVEFKLLDENKNTVYTDLKTNSEGICKIENLIPGKYYLEEIKTKEGYTKYDKLIPVNLTLNEEMTINISNYKDNKVVITTNTGNITVGNQNSSIEIDTSNSNTNINSNNQNTNINNNNQNANINNNNQNTNINNNNQNTNINDNNQNANINNNNQNTNVNNNNQNTNISNLNGQVKLPKTGM